MSEDVLMTEWKDSSRIDGNREAGDGTDVVLALQQTSSPVILKPPLPTIQQPYESRRVNLGGQDLSGVSPNGNVAFNSTSETSKLLDITSSSSSESDLNLQIVPPKRKVRFKRKIRPLQKSMKSKGGSAGREEGLSSHSCCCCNGSESLAALAFILVLCALGALMWFHYGLSSRLDALQKQYNNMEAQSKETPEALHDYHIQLKGLESNVTNFGQDLKRINTEILSLHDAVKKLKEESSGLRESIAAAPEIKSLPKDVVSLTQSVASLGSKISMLESNVQDLKQGQHQLTDSARELKTENQQLKSSVAGLAVQKETTSTREDNQALRTSLTEYIHQELVQVASAVDDMNATVSAHLRELDQHLLETNQSLSWVTNDLAQLHVFVYQNLSSSLVKSVPISEMTLAAAVQQEAQRLLWEVLASGSRTNLSEAPSSTSDWREVLGQAHQVAQAYWALLRDLSLSSVEQEPVTIVEDVLAKAVTHLTANTTLSLQTLNSSLKALTLRTEALESSSHLIPVQKPTSTEPSPIPRLESPVVPKAEDKNNYAEISKRQDSSAANYGVQEVSSNPPPTSTVPTLLEKLLRSQISASAVSSDNKLHPGAADLVAIP